MVRKVTVAFYAKEDTLNPDALPHSVFTGTEEEVNIFAGITGQCFEILELVS